MKQIGLIVLVLATAALGAVPTPVVFPQDAEGFSVFTPAADARVFYVSSSTGSDTTGAGTQAAPFATIGRAYSHVVNSVELGCRSGFPDQILLKRGDTFTTPILLNKSGRSATEPMLIGAYGTSSAARPILNTGSTVGIEKSQSTPVHFLALQSLDVRCSGAGQCVKAIGNGTNQNAGLTYWTIEDCSFQGAGFNIVMQTQNANDDGSFREITLRRCQIRDAYGGAASDSSGIFFAGYAGNLVVEECVFDHNGWDYAGSVSDYQRRRNHNGYVYNTTYESRFTYRNNVTANASATGIQMRGGGVCTGNLALNNPVGILIGYGGTLAGGFDPVTPLVCTVEDNVVWGAAEFPTGAWGIMGMSFVQIAGGGTCKRNLFGVSGMAGDPVAFGFESLGDRTAQITQNVVVDDNVVFNYGEIQFEGNAAHLSNITFTNNRFSDTNTARKVFNHYNSNVPTQIKSGGNTVVATAGANRFAVSGFLTNFAGWSNAVGGVATAHDTTSALASSIAFPASSRTVASYAGSVGLSATDAAFVTAALGNRKGAWSANYTAAGANAYLRAGFWSSPSAQSPVAHAGPDQVVVAGAGAALATVTFQDEDSKDPDGSIVSWSWSMTVGEIVTTPSGGTPTTPIFTLPLGVNTVVLTVTDNDGRTGSDSVVATVEPAAPATVLVTPGTTTASVSVAAGPTGVDGYAFEYGTTAAYGTTATSGTNSATLTGLTANTTYHIKAAYSVGSVFSPYSQDVVFTTRAVSNTAPTANAGADQGSVTDTGRAGAASVTLDGSASSDADGTIAAYLWTWAGGTATGSGPTVTLPLGVTTVSLVVTDNLGATSNTDAMLATVKAAAPVGMASVPLVGGAHLTATAYPAAGSYSWKWGTTTGYGTTVSTAIPALDLTGRTAGVLLHWTVAAVASDGTIGAYAADQTVTPLAASNAAPVVDAGPNQTVTITTNATYKTVTLAGTATDADGSVASVAWYEGGRLLKSTPTNGTVNQVLASAVNLGIGSHVLTLRATDDLGYTVSDTVAINVKRQRSGWMWRWYRPRRGRNKGNGHGR